MPLTREQFQALRAKGLSVEQIVKFEKGEKPNGQGSTPMSAKPQASGPGFWDAVSPKISRNVGIGAVKGAGSTVAGLADLPEKLGSAIGGGLSQLPGLKQVGQFIGKGIGLTPDSAKQIKETKTLPTQLREGVLKPQGTAQKVGFGAEQIGEFFIPGGAEAKGAKFGEELASKIPTLAKEAPQMAKFATKVAQVAAKALPKSVGAGLEAAAKKLAQTEDVKSSAEVGVLGAGATLLGEVAAPIMQKALPGLAKKMEMINLRLTPTQKQNAEKKINDVVEYMTKNKIVGTPNYRYNHVIGELDKMEPKLQAFFEKEASGVTVKRADLIAKLKKTKDTYQNERDVLAIEKQLDEAIDLLKKKYPKDIPVARLNQLKRSTYKNAYNKAGDKVLDFVEHDIGDTLRVSIEDATKDLKVAGKPIGDFNKEYGTLINAEKLLKVAKSRAQVGLVGKVVSTIVGEGLGTAVGGPVGGAAGAVVGTTAAKGLAGTLPRSLLGATAQTISDITPNLAGSTAKIASPFIPGRKNK